MVAYDNLIQFDSPLPQSTSLHNGKHFFKKLQLLDVGVTKWVKLSGMRAKKKVNAYTQAYPENNIAQNIINQNEKLFFTSIIMYVDMCVFPSICHNIE